MQPFNNHLILKGGIIVKSKRKRLAFLGVIIMVIALFTACGGLQQNAEEEIAFECPILEQAVRDADGYTGEPIGPIYPPDVLGITTLQYIGSTSPREIQVHNIIYEWEMGKSHHVLMNQETEDPEQNLVPRAKITSLEGIQYLINLTDLRFSCNNVSDISPVQNLTNLERLDFNENNVSDISPVQNLTNLEVLVFSVNNVSDISPLQNLTKLSALVFNDNNVSDITSLVANSGLGSGDEVFMYSNNLNLIPGSQNMNDINALIGRGVAVYY